MEFPTGGEGGRRCHYYVVNHAYNLVRVRVRVSRAHLPSSNIEPAIRQPGSQQTTVFHAIQLTHSDLLHFLFFIRTWRIERTFSVVDCRSREKSCSGRVAVIRQRVTYGAIVLFLR